mgnify:FL=1
MFDIGFWELAVIAVVALIILGPEKFPGMVRTVMSWIRKARELMSDAKTSLEQEVDKVNEIKQRIVEETKIADIHRAIDETRSTVAADFKDLGSSKIDAEAGTDAHAGIAEKKTTDTQNPDTPTSHSAGEQPNGHSR